MENRIELNRQLGYAYRRKIEGNEGGAVAALHSALADDADLLRAARARNAEMAAVLAAGRLCHLTRTYHDLLTPALKGLPNG